MTTQLDSVAAHYAAELDARLARVRDPERIRLRRAAFERFEALGFPTTRAEDWRHTPLGPLPRTAYALTNASVLVQAGVAPPPLEGEVRLTLGGGYVTAPARVRGDLPTGVVLGSLAELSAAAPDWLSAHLARHADVRADAFAALNTAFLDDGAVVYVPRGGACAAPLHIVHVAPDGPTPAVSFPRTLIVVEAGATLDIVEQFVGGAGAEHCTNAVTELVAGPAARVRYARLVREAKTVHHIGALHVALGRDTQVSAHVVTLGGGLVRHNLTAVLAEPGADCALYGLHVSRGTQHVDHHLRVEHAAPHGTSRELIRGILDDRAHGVFTGRIIVRPGAQRTDAKQTHKSLLLSGTAQADSRPQLEIYADDVKCTHGATVGQVDEEGVFYLRSRGLPADAARSLLVYAFAEESVASLVPADLHDQVRAEVLARLPHGELLRDAP